MHSLAKLHTKEDRSLPCWYLYTCFPQFSVYSHPIRYPGSSSHVDLEYIPFLQCDGGLQVASSLMLLYCTQTGRHKPDFEDVWAHEKGQDISSSRWKRQLVSEDSFCWFPHLTIPAQPATCLPSELLPAAPTHGDYRNQAWMWGLWLVLGGDHC